MSRILYEPMTFFTDLLLGVAAVYFGMRAWDLYFSRFQLCQANFGWTFLLLGASAIFGGIGHGFGPHLPMWLNQWILRLVLLAMLASSLFLLLGALAVTVPWPAYRFLRWLPAALGIVASVMIWRSPDFSAAARLAAPALLGAILLLAFQAVTAGSPAAARSAWGLVIVGAGLMIQVMKVSPAQWFNHNDLFHLVALAGLALVYRGMQDLTDAPF